MKKKIIGILLFTLSTLSFSYINLYPLKFEKNITKGAEEEFFLYNRTSKIRKYRVYVEKRENEKNTMVDWIEVYPKSITLPPLKEGSVKIQIKSPKGTPAGEYTANLVLKEVSLPILDKKEREKSKKHKVMTMVKLKLKGFVSND